MTGDTGGIRFICPTYVHPGREQEFEDFINDVVWPAVRTSRPHMADHVTVLRPAAESTGSESAYVFLFSGDYPIEAWDVSPLLEETHGAEEGQRLNAQFEDFMAREQLIFAVGDTVDGR